jgi:hypothetical protein
VHESVTVRGFDLYNLEAQTPQSIRRIRIPAAEFTKLPAKKFGVALKHRGYWPGGVYYSVLGTTPNDRCCCSVASKILVK